MPAPSPGPEVKPWPLQASSDVPTLFDFPAPISNFRKSPRILPSHDAYVQPPRKHHYPAPRASLRGGAATSSFTLSTALARVTLNFRSAGWRN
jgi:hypothetical protein